MLPPTELTSSWARLLGSLLGSGLLLGRTLLRLGFCFRRFVFGRLHLLRLGFLLRQLGSLEALTAERDLGDADGGVRLTVSAQFLVLLLALVVEDQDFCAAAFFDDFADDARIGLVRRPGLLRWKRPARGTRPDRRCRCPVSPLESHRRAPPGTACHRRG